MKTMLRLFLSVLFFVTLQRSTGQESINSTTANVPTTEHQSCASASRREEVVAVACADSLLPIDLGEGIGLKQDVTIMPDLSDDLQHAIQSARTYMANFDFTPKLYRRLQEDCRNKHELCALWAVAGECQKTPLYMNLTCAPMCHACEYLLPEVRCPIDPNGKDAWYPGDLNKMFERITTDPKFSEFKPTILSRPSKDFVPQEPTLQNEESTTIPYQSSAPWMITLDHFMSPEEADHLQHFVKEENYEPRRILYPEDEWKDTPTAEMDTFSANFCSGSACMQDPTIRSMMNRLTDLTHIPEDNYEHLQFLRYQVGQFAATHTDYLIRDSEQQQGVRLFSVLFYFSDVEEGGGTYFPQLNLTVSPRKGRALIWPNVLNEDPHREDRRTSHKGSPIIKGKKIAASILAHQRNFRAPHAMHCVRGLQDD